MSSSVGKGKNKRRAGTRQAHGAQSAAGTFVIISTQAKSFWQLVASAQEESSSRAWPRPRSFHGGPRHCALNDAGTMSRTPAHDGAQRQQIMYRHMAQHQEIAKLVAFAHLRGELPAVGPLLVKRPDYRAENERALARAEDEERRMSMLRSKSSRGEGAPKPPKPAPRAAAADASAPSARPRRHGGGGGGSSAARERVRVRLRREGAVAAATARAEAAPAGPVLHVRRLRPYSTLHVLPASVGRPEPVRVQPPARVGAEGGAPVALDARARREPPGAPPTRVVFGTAVAERPIERSQQWSRGRTQFWETGEGVPELPADEVSRAHATTRQRTDTGTNFPAPGVPLWPPSPRRAVGEHLGPGAYAKPYGDRVRDPWTLPVDERLRPSSAFVARESVRLWSDTHAGSDELGAHARVGPDGVLVEPRPASDAGYARYTLAQIVRARTPPRSLLAHGDASSIARPTFVQQQRAAQELARRRSEQVEARLAADPANDSATVATHGSAASPRIRPETLLMLGGVPPGGLRGSVTTDSLTAVSSRLLGAGGAAAPNGAVS